MLKEFLFKLDVIAPAVALFSSFIFYIIRRRALSFSDYILLIFLVVQLILNSTATMLQNKLINNLWVYHLNCLVTQVIFTFYFFKSIRNKRVIYAGFLSFCIVFVLMITNIQSYTSFPSYTYSFASFIIVLYALLFLNEIIETLPSFQILSLKEFWTLTGILTYFGSSFFIFISYNYLSLVSPKKVYILWQFQNIFLSFGCIIFLKAITSKKWIPK